MNLPPDEVMRQMAKLATEQAGEFFARMADEFAKSIPEGADGRMTLRAFANAIRATNAKSFPVGRSNA